MGQIEAWLVAVVSPRGELRSPPGLGESSWTMESDRGIEGSDPSIGVTRLIGK